MSARRPALLVIGAALVAVFMYVDRRLPAAVLPPSTFGAGPLKWIYLTLGVLMAATMADMYVPFFGQRLAAPDAGGGRLPRCRVGDRLDASAKSAARRCAATG